MEPLQRAVLELAAEDFTALWEVWAVVENQSPGATVSETLATAERSVRDLIRARLVELYRCESNVPTDDPEICSAPAVEAALHSRLAWMTPEAPDSPFGHFYIAATDEGARRVGLVERSD